MMSRRFLRPIFVTKPMLPPLPALVSGLERIYESGIVTNMGPMHNALEAKLHAILGGKDLILFNNGTSALVAALHAMDLPKGSEVITTPFSFAATAHAISALGLKPVFADIDADSMTLDPSQVKKKVNENTSCILAVHVYGFPCDLNGFEHLSVNHDLKLVYDAAHAFGTCVAGFPIARFGHASAFSFHATKLFNSIEGGCVCSNLVEPSRRVRGYRNFGIKDEDTVDDIGLNGKMSEFHALTGLLNLEGLQNEMAGRKQVRQIYTNVLSNCRDIEIPAYAEDVTPSYQYYPIRILRNRDGVYRKLKEFNIFTRRYFYPLIADFDIYRDCPSTKDLPQARRAASEVLCLPFYADLADGTANTIAELVCSIVDSKV